MRNRVAPVRVTGRAEGTDLKCIGRPRRQTGDRRGGTRLRDRQGRPITRNASRSERRPRPASGGGPLVSCTAAEHRRIGQYLRRPASDVDSLELARCSEPESSGCRQTRRENRHPRFPPSAPPRSYPTPATRAAADRHRMPRRRCTVHRGKAQTPALPVVRVTQAHNPWPAACDRMEGKGGNDGADTANGRTRYNDFRRS